MSDDPAGQDKVFTQEEVDALVEERNRALEAKREEILKELKGAKDKLRHFDGVDPEEHRELKRKLAELEQAKKAEKAGITSEQLDRMRAEVRQDLEREFAPLQGQVEALSRENRELKLDNRVKEMMTKHDVRGDRVDALFRLTEERWDLTEDGKPVLRDRMASDVGKYIADELSKEYPEFFLGSGSSGGGASKSVASGTGRVRQISMDDGDAFMANLEAIAKGEVQVVE